MAERKFLEIDVDNFDDRMKAMKPRVAFQVPNTLTGEGNLRGRDHLREHGRLLARRGRAQGRAACSSCSRRAQQLANLLTYMDGKTGAEELIAKVLRTRRCCKSLAAARKPAEAAAPSEASSEAMPSGDPSWLKHTVIQAAPLQGIEYQGGEFASLLNKEFKPKTDDAQASGRAGGADAGRSRRWRTPALIGSDAIKSIEAMIAEIDRKLTEQVNAILHHADFQQLEGAWRGLHYLVNNTETDEMLKIRVMNISKKELGKTLKRYKGTAWDQSPLFKKVYEEEYGMFGGEPFGCLVGDYYFDHSPPDVELLGEMRKIAAAAHTPVHRRRQPDADADGFVAGADQPARSDQDLQDARVRRVALAARVRGLALHRPHDAALPGAPAVRREDQPGRGVRLRGGDRRRPITPSTPGPTRPTRWRVNINRSFKLYGWCTRIRGVESGGAVEGLPTHTFPTDDGGVDDEVPDRDRHQRPPRGRTRQERLHAAACTARTPTSRPSSARSRCRSRASTTTRTPRPTRTSRRACPTCSPAAASRTTSSASCATRSAPSRSAKTWQSG